MAINVLPSKKSWGNILGTGLSEGLSQGIQGLAQAKVNQMHTSNFENALQMLANPSSTPEQRLKAIASFPEHAQKAILPNLGAVLQGSQGGQQQGTEEQQGASNIADYFKNPVQAIREKEVAIKQENQNIKKQAEIDKYAKPYIEEIEKKGSPARHTIKTAQNIIDLVETGKAITGPWGAITPQSIQTNEGQQLITDFADLVLSRAQLGGGVLHKTRLALEELRKPAIWQHPETIKRLAYKIKNDPEIMKEYSKAKASEELIQKWGEKVPADYKPQIEKRAKEIRSGQKQEFRNKWVEFLESKYPANKYSGKTIRGKETGLTAKSNGKSWVIV